MKASSMDLSAPDLEDFPNVSWAPASPRHSGWWDGHHDERSQEQRPVETRRQYFSQIHALIERAK